ncbi:MAG: RluA family pseudouridine synthase [Rhizobiales bacterium]|nr:RluA family pseudouridine synthase [Hyphomicrobiales bacterium]
MVTTIRSLAAAVVTTRAPFGSNAVTSGSAAALGGALPCKVKRRYPITPRTAAIASIVVRPAISIIARTRATIRTAAGSSGSSSAKGLLMDLDRRNETVVVADTEAGGRLDRLLAARIADLSRSRLKALILAGEVAVGGGTIRDPGHRVNAGDTIVVTLPPPEPAEPEAEAIPLAVVHEDDDLVVIDKPAGLVVHPAAGHRTGTLVNALIAHCGDSLSGIGGVRRPGIVHRLDKDTSGLLVVAKNDAAHKSLAAQFADHGRTGALARGYLAFVWGNPPRPKGTIDAPIDRHPRARDKMAVRQGGREAVTHWIVLERYVGIDGRPVASLVECRLETGRTHQIRVHLAHIGHPLLGDDVYGLGFKTKAALLSGPAGEALEALGRQALHAYLLGIDHPTQGEYLEFRSELPDDLRRLRDTLDAQGAFG